MNKTNQILFGIIILLIGMLSLLHSVIKLDYFSISVIIVGFAFLLLYRTKKQSWALVMGCYIMYIGLCALMNTLGFHSMVYLGISGMFFIVPGVIFFVSYLYKNKRGLLYPSSFLFWLGIYVVASGAFRTSVFAPPNAGLFLLCIGLALMTIYYFGRAFVKKSLLYLSVVCLFFGVASILGLSVGNALLGGSQFILSGVIIVISLVIIFRAIKK